MNMFRDDYNMMQDSDDMKCVWMTSGIISYKLCSIDFNCEECAFDRVMHNSADADTQQKTMNRPLTPDTVSDGLSSNLLDGSLFYHKNHCWIKVVNPHEVVIGINGILAKLMSGIRTVVLPRIGDPVLKNQVFAHIMLEKQIVPLIMPVNGEVIAVNETLEKQPELLLTGSSEKGWLVTIKADNLEKELRTLSFGSKAMAWYRSKEKNVNEALFSACNANGEQLGATMHDGGELIPNASELLTSEQFSTILDEL
ncbi:MAG: glycine cleavage system protein H [Desulfuromonadaceae bacterium]